MAFVIVMLSGLAPLSMLAFDSPEKRDVIQTSTIDVLLLEKVRRLYPDATEQRRPGQRVYSVVQEVARASDGRGDACSIIAVQFVIPSTVDHGTGDLLIFKSDHDLDPAYRMSLHRLPNRGGKYTVINNRWLQIGDERCFVAMTDDVSLGQFAKFGTQTLLSEFCLNATKNALNQYLEKGRAAFLERASLKKSLERDFVELPDRIIGASIYHSMVEDMRCSEFKYSSAWEGTMLAQIIPTDADALPIVIEFGITGEEEGTGDNDMKVFVWRAVTKEPEDRPVSTFQWAIARKSNE